MQLTPRHYQKSKTLEEFYGELGASDELVTRQRDQIMLSLLVRLRELQDGRYVWVSRSDCLLCFFAADNDETPCVVKVATFDARNYLVEYLMPDHVAPWPDAWVSGVAPSEDEAVQMVLTGMEKSQGWSQE